MELQIASDDEITLPDWIGATSLTLAEIGAVACLACMKNGNKESGARMQTEEMAAALGTLKEKNVLQISLEGRRLSSRISDREPTTMKTPQPAQSGSLHPICSAWVAVSSALPQPDEDVLLWGILDCETRHGCHKGCRKATGYGHEWFESVTSPDGCNHDEITSVSHWMPLPCEPNNGDRPRRCRTRMSLQNEKSAGTDASGKTL